MCDRYFGSDFVKPDSESHDLLETIRVTHNLMYLTDRLPKPKYETIKNNNKSKTTYKLRNDIRILG